MKLNVDENQATAAKYEVLSIPTMILFKNGEVAKKVIGAYPRSASGRARARARVAPHALRHRFAQHPHHLTSAAAEPRESSYGRRLLTPTSEEAPVDPARLTWVVEAIPPGRWMSYADVVAAAGGTPRQAIGGNAA